MAGRDDVVEGSFNDYAWCTIRIDCEDEGYRRLGAAFEAWVNRGATRDTMASLSGFVQNGGCPRLFAYCRKRRAGEASGTYRISVIVLDCEAVTTSDATALTTLNNTFVQRYLNNRDVSILGWIDTPGRGNSLLLAHGASVERK